MLNKIKIVGKILSVEVKAKEEEEKNEFIFYFSLLVPSPSGSLTVLRYIDSKNSNQAQLQGRIVGLKFQPNNDEPETLSFQMVVPRRKNLFSGFFCRVQGELISKLKSHLKEGREALVEGFLQTKKMVGKDNENETKISRFSHIICCAFTFADDDSPIDLNNPDKLTKITGRVKKIDFSIDCIDYKNTDVLRRFINNQGRIVGRLYSRLTAKTQRKVTRAIKRARQMALLPYTIQKKVLAEEKAQELYKRVNNFTLNFTLKKNEKGEPFGSVGFKEISQELEKVGIHLEKSHLVDFHSLNKLGENGLQVKLSSNLVANLKIKNFDSRSQSVINNLKENQNITVHGNVGGRDNGLLRVVEFETGDGAKNRALISIRNGLFEFGQFVAYYIAENHFFSKEIAELYAHNSSIYNYFENSEQVEQLEQQIEQIEKDIIS
ncbi:17144_t:CDS:2 [Funneliformis geosporum]|nr:17144_t:CDS:2 [Funneliformis geosporum]